MRLSTHVANAIDAAGRSTESHLTKELRREALEAGWPAEAARSISVTHQGGGLHVSHEADEWEYGDETRPPLPVIRHFLHRVDEHPDEHFMAELNRSLGGLL